MWARAFLSRALRRVFFYSFVDYSVVMSELGSTEVTGAKESDAG